MNGSLSLPPAPRLPGPLLVVSPDASRTGTPRLLHSWLSWIRHHTDASVELVLGTDGPLVEELSAVAPVRIVEQGRVGAMRHTAGSALRELGRDRTAEQLSQRAWRRTLGHCAPPGILLLNGAASLRVLTVPWPWPRPKLVVGQLHEMATALERSLAGLDPDPLLRQLDAIVVVSESVRDEVVGRGVDPERVLVHPGWVPDVTGKGTVSAPDADKIARRRQNLGIGEGAAVVGGCGTVGWRKGTDLFLAVAQQMLASGSSAHFVWVGAPHRPVDDLRIHADIEARGLTGRVHFVGEQPDPAAWFGLFDVLAVTSREDPYPLVALEAGAAGVPVAGFATGGVAELLAEAGLAETGLAAPLDVVGLAEVITARLADPIARAQAGRTLANVVHRQHTTTVAAPRLWADLCRLTPQDPPRL